MRRRYFFDPPAWVELLEAGSIVVAAALAMILVCRVADWMVPLQ